MPVAATIGAVSYETLDAALSVVRDGETIVVNAGEYKLTGSQSAYSGKAFTVKAAEGATVSFDMSAAVTLGGAKITFEGVTFDYKTNGNYIGLQHADTLVYNDCTINGMVFLYATSETFNRCTFNQSLGGAYNVWTYGAQKVAFNGCAFNCAGKSVLVYNEGTNEKTDLTVASCEFKASAEATGKAAIEIDTSLMKDGASVAIDDQTTATGFATGSNSGSTLWNDKKQTKDTNKNVTVTVAGETVFAPVVAKIGETGYASLADALAAAKNGETVTLLADVNNADYTVANVIDVSLASGVTLDGNGKTLSGNVKVTVASAGGVTIKNVLFKDIHNAAVVSADAKEKYGFGDAKVGTLSAVYAPKLAGSLTVTGCTFENCDWEALQITPAEGAKIDIRENVFKTSASDLVADQLRHLHIEMAYGTGFDYEGTDIAITVTDNQFLGGAKDAAAGIWWVGKTSVLALSGNYYAEPDTVSITLSDGKNRTNRCDLIYPARSQADVDVDDLMAIALILHDAFNASSYSTLAEAIAAARDGETVKLLADATVTEPVVIEKAITLDLDGKTVTSTWAMPSGASGDGRYAFLVRADATVCNGTLAAGQARALGAYASLTLTKATVTSALTGGHCCVAFCAEGGSYTVMESRLSGDYAVANFANNATVVIANSVLEGSGCGLYHNGQNFGLKMTVTDSTVNGAIDSAIAEGRDPSGVYVSGSLETIGNEANQNGVGEYHQVTFVGCTIKGNTGVEVKYTDLHLEDCTVVATTQTPSYKGNNDGMAALGFAVVATDNSKGTTPKPAGSITITGEKGSYTGLVGLGALASVKETFADFEDTATIAISGGIFSSAVLPDYCAAGFIPTANGDGTFGVKKGAYVAAIGEVKYETLAEAIAAAKAGDAVTLLADTLTVEATKTDKADRLTVGVDLTLELNGHTLTTPYELEPSDNWASFYITSGSLTVKDSGGNGGIRSGDKDHLGTYLFHLQGGDLIVESGNFFGGCTIANVQKGTATIKGGRFEVCVSEEEDCRFLLNCIDASYKKGEAHIVVFGGTFVGYDPRNNAAEGPATNFVAPGVGVDADENGVFTAKPDMCAQITDADGNSVTAHKTLQAAFDAAKKGDTVTLLSDITLTEQVNITKALDGLTFDGNNKTITCATTTDPFQSGGSALYFGNANDRLYCTGIAIKDLTMSGTARFAIFLCGGTSTTFTNVKISGKYYYAVNLYGTHGATMTDCNISNSMTGETAAIWSNVASANPLTLNNTTVNVIAINAYTTDNKLEPKIYVNEGSTVDEIHTYDDGSVSGDTRLCVGASPVMPSVKIYDETSKTWIDAPDEVFVDALIGGGRVTLPASLLAQVLGTTRVEQFANLSKADENGNLAWVNIVAGIDSAKKVTMTAPQNNEPAVIDIGLPTVGEAPEGTDVTVRYEIRADGSEAVVVSAEEAEDLVINLNGKAGICTYRAYVCLHQNGSEVACVESANALGVLQTVCASKKTIIAVPWLSLTDGNAIAVADLVKTAGLTAGDKLHVYNKAENRYDVYELTADKAWAPKAIYKVGADGTVETASSGTPETTTIARGSGVWIERQDTTQPIVSYGAVASATVATTIDEGTAEKKAWNLLAVPTTTAIDIAATFGASETDEIIVPTDGAPKVCTVKDGAWGYDKSVPKTDESGNQLGVKVVREAVTELPAGTGFWYLNGGAAKTVNW